MLRLIGLSSTISVRKPPDNEEEKESRDLWRAEYFRGDEGERQTEDADLVRQFDIGLHGGVRGRKGEADTK